MTMSIPTITRTVMAVVAATINRPCFSPNGQPDSGWPFLLGGVCRARRAIFAQCWPIYDKRVFSGWWKVRPRGGPVIPGSRKTP